MSFRLENLPASVLGSMLESESYSFLVIRLWKCGSSVLNTKLASCVTRLQLTAELFTCRFPRLILEMRGLRYLRVKSPGELTKNSKNWSSIAKNLPRSLEELHLDSKDAHLAFMNFAPKWRPKQHEYIAKQYPLGRSCFVDIASILPRLHTLEMRCSSAPNAIHPSDLPGLPSTLTSLTATINFVYDTTYASIHSTNTGLQVFGGASLLPPSLTALNGDIRLSFPQASPEGRANALSDWSRAPKLQTLAFHRSSVVPEEVIPKTAIDLEITLAIWDLKTSQAYPPLANSISLPDTIDQASFKRHGTDWLAEIPKHVEKLSAILPWNTTFPVASLPRLLKHIVLSNVFDWSIVKEQLKQAHEPSQFWPPQLASMTALFSNFDLEADIQTLPQTLTRLAMRINTENTEEEPIQVAGNFPPNLTYLSLRMPWSSPKVLKMMSPLPSSLITVELYQAQTEFVEQALPDSLKHLMLGIPMEEAPLHWRMPSQLTSLSISIMDSSAFETLPRALTRLNITEKLTDLDNKRLKGHLFVGLPSGITDLSVRSSSISDFPSQRLATILPRLESLELTMSITIPSEFIRELPPTIRKFMTQLENFTEETIPFIPPKLIIIPPRIPYPLSPNEERLIGQYWPIRCGIALVSPSVSKEIQQRQREAGWSSMG